ncbi:hypothetical protein AB0L57_05945 [Nocardia sp. NPDC052254]|uniref:hypothetical protein n=1 Tax=Nocardia sp. NPDC052254 TaxID=3155681 RepID=UPI00341D132A
MECLTPRDATGFWLSRRARNDLFLLYCFDDAGYSDDWLRAAVIERSARIPDLRLRIREHRFAYPDWEPSDFDDSQIVVHNLGEPLWTNVEAAVGQLLGDGLPAERYVWRLHLFRGIRQAPGGSGPAVVVVLQLSHALADGRRAAAIARELLTGLGETGPDLGSSVDGSGSRRFGEIATEGAALLGLPFGLARTVVRGFAAARAGSEMERLAAAGEIPGPAPDFEPTLVNRGPAPARRSVRMIVGEQLRVPGHTVTVVALTAISVAMSGYLGGRGEPAERLGAQVSVAGRPPADPAGGPKTHPRNNYRDVTVDLAAAEPDLCRRAGHIARALAERRARATHPLQSARDHVTAALPAPVLRRDLANFPLDSIPARISGHTVLSSVDRGPADLSIAGGAVRFTAGFPALGAVMHLTHGLHGLGRAVTVSIHADPRVLPDVDEYAQLLRAALRDVADRLRG